jgi:hypothetical protein
LSKSRPNQDINLPQCRFDLNQRDYNQLLAVPNKFGRCRKIYYICGVDEHRTLTNKKENKQLILHLGDSLTMTAAFSIFLHYNEENTTNSFFCLRNF